MKILVTGAAGFIGSQVSKRLLDIGYQVIGIDNLNHYYDVTLKKARLNLIKEPSFTFHKLDLLDREKIIKLFDNENFSRVIHLAAQSGVRYSLENPYVYAETNLVGYLNILEGCRHSNIQHLIYASSSSVYGMNYNIPFSTENIVEYPVSLYAATKKSNELLSHAYSYLYDLPTTGLRLFTVYGPWCRPDMALFKFTKAIIEGKDIDIYNYGEIKRDFTYIDDIVEAIIRIQDINPRINKNSLNEKSSPIERSDIYRIYNIGNGHPVRLIDYVAMLEEALGIKAKKKLVPNQLGDILTTSADTRDLYSAINFKPQTSIKDGIKRFVSWYKDFYNV